MTEQADGFSRSMAPGRGAQATTGPAAAARIGASFRQASRRAGGVWYAYGSLAGTPEPVFAQRGDEVVQAYSVNKVGVAVAVLDKVDRGLLALDQRVDVTPAIVVPDGYGIFSLDGAYPSAVTLGHALVALLTVSDDTAARLCGLVCPAAELNEILAAKGFTHTRVEPVADPNRFFLGTSTARESHDLLVRLAAGELLSAASTGFLLAALRSPIAYTDGVRRVASSAERARVATKAGWFGTARHEAGVVFDAAGGAVLTYALFGFHDAAVDDFGATHPLVAARAAMGREFLDATADLGRTASAAVARAAGVRWPARANRPTNGG